MQYPIKSPDVYLDFVTCGKSEWRLRPKQSRKWSYTRLCRHVGR